MLSLSRFSKFLPQNGFRPSASLSWKNRACKIRSSNFGFLILGFGFKEEISLNHLGVKLYL
jgi:hypothetical protein